MDRINNKRKILIVDDDQNLIYFLSLNLKSHGFEVVSACDGYSGLNRLKTERPDLLILDLKMPNLGGFWVCKALKSQNEYKKIPIIIISGTYISEEDKAYSLSLGAEVYLEKPFKTEDLVCKIKELLEVV